VDPERKASHHHNVGEKRMSGSWVTEKTIILKGREAQATSEGGPNCKGLKKQKDKRKTETNRNHLNLSLKGGTRLRDFYAKEVANVTKERTVARSEKGESGA